MFRLPTCAIGLLAGLNFCSAVSADVLYVKPTPTGAAHCGSWADACGLTEAINSAVSGDEVWVRAGVYGPIGLKDGVKIIGGFAGNETYASQSNPVTNVTALDGGGTQTVVAGLDNQPSTVIRGFIIRNGFASEGGGMYLAGSSPTVVQCVFENNKAILGAGVYIRSFQYGAHSLPRFVNCEFRYNGAGESLQVVLPYGGGAVMALDSGPSFVNCLFHHNKAADGGAVVAGSFDVFSASHPFVNCTFAFNTAFHTGGAIFDPDGLVDLYNCILWGNMRYPGGFLHDQIYTGSGGTTGAKYCDIQGDWPDTGTFDADPLFQNAAKYDYRLQPGSPCIGTANNSYLPSDFADLDWDGDTLEIVPYDLALRSRTLGIVVDIGTYETPFCGDGYCFGDENSCDCPQDCGPAAQTEQVGSTCNDRIDNDCDSLTDCADSNCGPDITCMRTVPTVSEWGLVILTLLLLTGAKICFGHQPARRTILHTWID